MTGTSNTDAELWYSFKEGNRESFAAIYYKYFENLYEYGLRTINDPDIVKDCIHDLFVKLWTNKLTIGEVKNIKAYLLVSLRHLIYNKTSAGNRNRLLEVDDNYNFEMTWSAETKLIETEHVSEQRTKLLNAINNLSPRQKEIIYLRYFEELSYDEIAIIMNISTKATYKLSARALSALKEIYNMAKFIFLFTGYLVRTEFLR